MNFFWKSLKILNNADIEENITSSAQHPKEARKRAGERKKIIEKKLEDDPQKEFEKLLKKKLSKLKKNKNINILFFIII